jgi:hypothetical protein
MADAFEMALVGIVGILALSQVNDGGEYHSHNHDHNYNDEEGCDDRDTYETDSGNEVPVDCGM